MVAVNDAPPYRIVRTVHGEVRYSGFYVDIARELAKRLGVSLTFFEAPFPRALSMMRDGTADIMLGPNRTPEREAAMLFVKEPLPSETKSFFRHRGAADVTGYDDLLGRSIGVLRGALYFDRFDSDATLDKLAVNDYAGALRMVALDRLDLVVMPTLLGTYLVGRDHLPLVPSTFSVPGRPSYIALSRRSTAADRADDFAAVLASMKADGTFQRIEARYR